MGEGGGALPSRGLLGVTDTFTGLIVVMALQVYIYGKTYYLVHFKYCRSLIPRQRCLKKIKVYTLQSKWIRISRDGTQEALCLKAWIVANPTALPQTQYPLLFKNNIILKSVLLKATHMILIQAVTASRLKIAAQGTHCILVWRLNGELFHI